MTYASRLLALILLALSADCVLLWRLAEGDDWLGYPLMVLLALTVWFTDEYDQAARLQRSGAP